MVDILKAYQDGKNSISLNKKVDVQNKGVKPEKTLYSFIRNERDLKEFTDDYLYQAEVAFRKWFEIKMQDKDWVSNRFARKYRYSQIISEIFGRPYSYKLDNRKATVVGRMFGHYCSKIDKYYWDKETGVTKKGPAYNLSIQRFKTVTPFSLRLQYEFVKARGEVPTRFNVKRKNKFLIKGQARNSKVQRRKDKQAEIARKRYYEQVDSKKL